MIYVAGVIVLVMVFWIGLLVGHALQEPAPTPATAPPPTQPEGHEAWMLEAERLIDALESENVAFGACPTANLNQQEQAANTARAALLAHLGKKP